MRKCSNNLYQAIAADTVTAKLAFPVGERVKFNDTSLVNYEDVKIHNARASKEAPAIHQQGFCLLEGNFSIEDVTDSAALTRYTDAIIDEIKKVIHCKRVLPLGHVVRHQQSTDKNMKTHRPPATFVHNDWNKQRIQTLTAGPRTAIVTNDHLTSQAIKAFVEPCSRWSIYNIWMPLKTTITNLPLALCDVNSVTKDDRIEQLILDYPNGQTGELMSLHYRQHLQWFYYPLLQTNEMLFFRQYCSQAKYADDYTVFHTSFKLIADDVFVTVPRETIEFRFIVDES